jgi:hypothetical protein
MLESNGQQIENFHKKVGFFRDRGGHPNSAILLGEQLHKNVRFSGKEISNASRVTENLVSMLKRKKLNEIKSTQLDKILTTLPWDVRIAFFTDWMTQLSDFDQIIKQDPTLIESLLGDAPPEID